ncbi:MAG: glycosyltransferase [candidate division WOR-3 bacterium]
MKTVNCLPELSVIIPTRNRVQTLIHCLNCLENQTLNKSRYEVIVIDDASTDGTIDFLKCYSPSFDFKYFSFQKQLWPARARNVGIRAARGHFILFINDDTLLDKEALGIHLSTHKAINGDVSVLGRIDVPRHFIKNPFQYILAYSDLVFDYISLKDGNFYAFDHYYTCNVSSPVKALIAAGLFDEDYSGELWGGEDIDIGIRLQKVGVPLLYNSSCKGYHYHNLSVDDFCSMFKVRGGGAVRILAKYPNVFFHYTDINMEDIKYWRNLPEHILLKVKDLIDLIKLFNEVHITFSEERVILSERYHKDLITECHRLHKYRDEDIISLISHVRTPIVKALGSGILQTVEKAAEILFPAVVFLRWFHDMIGVCSSEWIIYIAERNMKRDLSRSLTKAKAVTITNKRSNISKGKILLLCDFFWPSVGGTEIFMGHLGERLVDAGFKVDVACRYLENRYTNFYKSMEIFSFDHSSYKDLRLYREFVESNDYECCILLAHPDTWVSSALKNVKKNDKRFIMLPSINKVNINNWQKEKKVNEILDILSMADMLITITENGYDAKLLRATGKPVFFIPNATDNQYESFDFRKTLGIDSNTALLVCVGNFWPVKNQLGLIEAFRQVDGDWLLAFVGNVLLWPKERIYFEICYKKALNDGRIKIIGPLNRKLTNSLIKCADILLVPSLAESGSPLVVLEAMSFGIPWIATPECNGVRDQAGGIVSNVEDFHFIIKKLLSKPKLMRELGSLGRQHWELCFNWDVVIKGFMDIINEGKLNYDFRMPKTLREANDKVVENILGK